MERIKTSIITIYNHKKLALAALTTLTTVGKYLWTYFTKGSQQADEYFDNQTTVLREKFVTLSDALFNYTEDLVLAQTPDAFDHIAQNIMDKARALAIAHRKAGLDLAEELIDTVQNTLQYHADEIIAAKSNTEVLKVLRKILKKLVYAAEDIPLPLDTLFDEVVDPVEEVVKASTSDDTHAPISTTIKNSKNAQLIQKQIGAILIEHEQEIIKVKDSNSFNNFLEVFKAKLVSAAADKIYNTDVEDYVAESTNTAVHNTEETHVFGNTNENTPDL